MSRTQNLLSDGGPQFTRCTPAPPGMPISRITSPLGWVIASVALPLPASLYVISTTVHRVLPEEVRLSAVRRVLLVDHDRAGRGR